MPTGTYFNPEKDLIIEQDLFFDQKDPQWRMITTYNGIRSNGQWFFSKNGSIIELLKTSLELKTDE
jgi:hypothetical protein